MSPYARGALSLQGRVALVAGAAGGIGHASAVRLLQAEARVILLDCDERAGQAAQESLRQDGLEAVDYVPVDVSSSESVAAAFDEADSLTGRMDILVNSAGIREIKPVTELDPLEWQRVLAINLSGPFHCIQQAIPRMQSVGGGSIVNIASVAGLIGMANRPAYTASKHGLVGLTRNLAHDLGPDRIRVNAIAPGTVRTSMTEAYYGDEDFLRQAEAAVPLGFGGTTSQVADAVLYLCSDLSAYVSGVVLPVDGGWLAEKNYAPTTTDGAYGGRASATHRSRP